MPKFFRERMTYANVTATLALFVAIGGTTAWAVDGPNPGQNTIGSEDIIGNEVRSDDIGNGRVFNIDLADDAIQGAKVKDNTLTGDDVNESTLQGLQRPISLPCPGDQAIASIDSGGSRTCIPVPPIADLIGSFTNLAGRNPGSEPCTIGDVKLTATRRLRESHFPASGQILPIASYENLFQLIGTTYGGDGEVVFALPDLRKLAPDEMTYAICVDGVFP